MNAPAPPTRRRIGRVVTLVVVVALSVWYVDRAEGHADQAREAAAKADATAAALRAEIRARLVSDCEGVNDARVTIRHAFEVTFATIEENSSDPEAVRRLAAGVDEDLAADLPIRDCEEVAREAIEAAETAVHQKEQSP